MMQKIIVSVIATCTITGLAIAGVSNDDLRYQQTKLVIKNHASIPVLLTMDDVQGTWEKPIALKVPVLLKENEEYRNTVISLKENDDVENFVSLDVGQVADARKNYLIFGESTNSKNHTVSADIVDGLGPLFVRSDTNYCDSNTVEGYAYCELTIRDN